MQLSRIDLLDLQTASRREWLLANGLGGYASGTATGLNTRRYHGLLMAALDPPAERTLFAAKTEDALDGVPLDCNHYQGEIVHPEGFRQLESFCAEKRPTFLYRVGRQWLEKSIFMVYGANLTIVQYKLLSPSTQATLTMRPFITYRHFHHLLRENQWPFAQKLLLEGKGVRVEAFPGAVPLFILSDKAQYLEDGKWYRGFLYQIERERGLDFTEDLYSPGYFTMELKAGESLAFAFAVPQPQAESVSKLLSGFAETDADELWQKEEARRQSLLEKAGTILPLHGQGEAAAWARDLVLAADSFIVRRGEGKRTVIAGCPWFGDWGRDTMIALEGLTLVTGRFDEAWEILTSFAQYCREGLLPNVFPDAGTEPAYNSVDAPLWFIHAVYRYWQYTLNKEVLQLYPTVRSIIEHFCMGTAFGIAMDEDGLIKMDNGQLTWMDAKVWDWVVTPRAGKPIEIQALWHNALCICAELASFAGEPAAEYKALAEKVRASAESYWLEREGYLADLAGDPQLRPNQLLAFSLPFPLFDLESEEGRRKASLVFAKTMEQLYIGPGLRSLGPKELAYQGQYGGAPLSRDGAYHQGTAWSWLLGPCLDVAAKLSSDLEEAREKLWVLLAPSKHHFYREGALGQVSEIFTGDWPYSPRGSVAQAWGVAEILRILGTYIVTERSMKSARYDA